jgi:hypothetical protein
MVKKYGKLPFVACKRKQKMEVCFFSRQMISSNWGLLFQQTCSSMQIRNLFWDCIQGSNLLGIPLCHILYCRCVNLMLQAWAEFDKHFLIYSMFYILKLYPSTKIRVPPHRRYFHSLLPLFHYFQDQLNYFQLVFLEQWDNCQTSICRANSRKTD